MDYERFLDALQEGGWQVPNRSYATHNFEGKWQIAFIRLGGKFQAKGAVSFVICIRSTDMRNLNGEYTEFEKEPHAYPFKLTFEELRRGQFSYQCKLNNYERSEIGMEDDWSGVLRAIKVTIPTWLGSYSAETLAKQIRENGEDGYIEWIWLEDLESAPK